MERFHNMILTLAVACFLTASCDEDKAVDTGPDVVEGLTVGAAGAELDLPGGGTLVVPAGALADDVALDISKIAGPRSNLFEAAGQFIQFKPASVMLQKPAAVELPYNTDDVSTEDGNLGIAWSTDGAVWGQLPTEVDQKDRVLSASLDGLYMIGPALFLKPSEICCMFSDDEGNKTGEVLGEETCQTQNGLVQADVAACEDICCEVSSGDGSKLYKVVLRAGCPQLGGTEVDMSNCEL